MSYILDALRKSEQERQRGKPPGLETVHPPLRSGEARTTVWPWLLAVALLVNASILLWWLEPWKERESGSTSKATQGGSPAAPGKDTPVAVEGAAKEPEPRTVLAGGQQAAVPRHSNRGSSKGAAAESVSEPVRPHGVLNRKPGERLTDAGARPGTTPPASPIGKAGQPRVVEPPKPPPAATGGPSTQPAALPPRIHEPLRPEAPKSAPPKSFPTPPPAAPASAAERGGGAESGLMEDLQPLISETRPARKEPEYRQIPTALRNSIPKLSLSFLVYSDRPADRRVTINGKVLREGEEVSDGLRLEQITQEGAVLSYRGVHFHKGVF